MGMRLLPYVLVLGLAIYALIDMSRSTPSDRAGLHPAAWTLIIVVPVLGPGAWLLVSRYQRGVIGLPPGLARARRPEGSTRPPRPRSPMPPRRRGAGAPDDDQDFLRGLDGDRPPGRGRRDDGGPASD